MDIKIPTPANQPPVEMLVKTASVKNAFEYMIMGQRNLLGYPLITYQMEHLDRAKDIVTSNFNELITGIGLQLRDYMKSYDDDSSEKITNLLQLCENVEYADIDDFSFSIYVPPKLLNRISHSYSIMPKATHDFPSRNFDKDIYAPSPRERTLRCFKEAMIYAQNKYGLIFKADLETVSEQIKKLAQKFDKGDRFTPSPFKRHKI